MVVRRTPEGEGRFYHSKPPSRYIYESMPDPRTTPAITEPTTTTTPTPIPNTTKTIKPPKARTCPEDWNETTEDFYIFSTIKTWIEDATKKVNNFTVESCACPSCQSAFNESASTVALEHFITTSNKYWWDNQISAVKERRENKERRRMERRGEKEKKNEIRIPPPVHTVKDTLPVEIVKKVEGVKKEEEFARDLKKSTQRPYTTDIPTAEDMLQSFQALRLEQEWRKALEESELSVLKPEGRRPALTLITDGASVPIFFDDDQSNPITVGARGRRDLGANSDDPERAMIAACLPPPPSNPVDAKNAIYSVRATPTSPSRQLFEAEAPSQTKYTPSGLAQTIHQRPAQERPSPPSKSTMNQEKTKKVPSSRRQGVSIPSYPTIPPSRISHTQPLAMSGNDGSGSPQRNRNRSDSAHNPSSFSFSSSPSSSSLSTKPLPTLPAAPAVPVLPVTTVPNSSPISTDATDKWLRVLTLTLGNIDILWTGMYVRLADTMTDDYEDYVVNGATVNTQDGLTRMDGKPGNGKTCFRDLRKLHASRVLIQLALKKYKHEFGVLAR